MSISRPAARALFLAGASALALSTPALADAAADEARELQELIVTADRGFGAATVQAGGFRNARVIDTPLTVNVVSREVLDAQAALGLYDALRNTAGVTRSQLNGGTYDNIAIRGILVENRGNYRLNGSLPVINLVEQPLDNKARVEVLKGAAALYYGFVPPSGVINMTTKRPEMEPLTVLTVRGDDHGSLVGAADVSRQFADGRIGARVNLAYGEVETGVRRVQGERSLAALALDLEPTDRLSVRVDYEYIEKDISEPAAIALLPAAGGQIALPEVPDPKQNLADTWQRYDAWAQNVLVRTDYRLSDRWAFKLEVGQAETTRDRYYSQFQNYDLATGEGQLQISQVVDQGFRNRNARAELTGLVDTGPIEHEITFGWTINERTSRGFSSPARLVSQNLYAPRPVARPTFAGPNPTPASRITDKGAYVFDRMSWGPVQVLAGLRWSDYESQASNLPKPYVADEVTPTVAVIYKPVPWASLYASYLEGLEEGGIAPANTANAFEVLPPAKSDQWEVGAKAELGRSVVASVAYFQITRPLAFTDPATNRFVLNGEVEYRGVEIMASGNVTSDLSLIASALWLDAEQARGDPRLNGKRPENTAEWTASVFADWRTPWVEGLSVNAGLFYTGDRAANPLNQAFIDGYITAAFGARYEREIAGRETTFQVNVENAFDKTYWNTAGNNLLGVGAPRTVKFTVSTAL